MLLIFAWSGVLLWLLLPLQEKYDEPNYEKQNKNKLRESFYQ